MKQCKAWELLPEEKVYLKSEVDAEIEKLKQKLEDVNELIKTARQMLEDAKATHYADSVEKLFTISCSHNYNFLPFLLWFKTLMENNSSVDTSVLSFN